VLRRLLLTHWLHYLTFPIQRLFLGERGYSPMLEHHR
jgi:hypothetical protein